MFSHRYALIALACLTIAPAGCQAPTPVAQVAVAGAAVAAIPVGKAPHGIAAAAGFIYNSNTGDGTISVIDAKSDKVVKTIALSEGKPGYAKASHDGKYILVLNGPAGKLHVYAPGQDHALLQSIAVGKGPDKFQLSEDDRKVWVSLTGEAAIAELSFAEGLAKAPATRKLSVGAVAAGDEHRALALSASWLATPNSRDNDLSLIDRVSGSEQRVRAGNGPSVLAIGGWENQDRSLIIGNSTSNSITFFHLDTRIANTIQDVGQTPTDIAVVPELTRAFITMAGSNEVAVVDYRAQKLLARIPVGKRPVHIYKIGEKLQIQHAGHELSELWVGNDSGDSVSVIDSESLKVKATVPVGKGHHKMAFWSDRAYVSNLSDGSVSVVSRASLSQVAK